MTDSAAPHVDVLGVGISCVTLDSTVDIFEGWITDQASHYVCVTGMHGVMESQSDSTLRDIHNRSGLTTPDGMPMVWAGRHCGAASLACLRTRPDAAVLARANELGWSNYFLGGAPGAIECLLDSLQGRYPDLVVAGHACPPFRPLSAAEDSGAGGADQRRRPRHHLGRPGHAQAGALDVRTPCRPQCGGARRMVRRSTFVSGRLAQAPPWMQRNGLEWLFRLRVEPRRLWRRPPRRPTVRRSPAQTSATAVAGIGGSWTLKFKACEALTASLASPL